MTEKENLIDDEIAKNFALNVLAVLSSKNIRIGAFEMAHGVRAGYLSRKVTRGGNLNLSVAYEMARSLNYDLTNLIEKDYVKYCREQEIFAEITKLQNELRRLESK